MFKRKQRSHIFCKHSIFNCDLPTSPIQIKSQISNICSVQVGEGGHKDISHKCIFATKNYALYVQDDNFFPIRHFDDFSKPPCFISISTISCVKFN